MIISVVGAGIIGLTAALTLADRGHTVTVHDPAPASGASHHAGGMLAPTAEVVYKQDPLFPLMRASAEWYPDLIALTAKYTDLPTGYRTDGTLVVARDTADKTHLEELRDYQSRHGMEVDKLTVRQARKLEPALSPALAGAVAIGGDHQVQPRLFTRALIDACRSANVTFSPNRIESLDALDGDQVVVANGLGASQLVAGLDLRPVYGDVLHVRVPQHQYPLLTRVVRGFVEDRPVYLIPREDGTLTIGASTREDGRDQPQVQGIHQLMRDAIELVPALEECDFIEATAGARPGTPDDLPYLGRIDDRTVVSTGYFRHGILLAALGARCGAELVEKHTPAIDLSACDPRRHT
ncbi:glycine oxidase ThiO [Corynebacterium sp. zg912]|uniref:glycine oxidase n=1 Tax=Corynebacterium wankanglinii TaxID=2735136 RepID=A0A7H0KBC8_9CORY|nr:MULTISPECIES: glycine oxidase ThiO [Corynebacterium]MBA1838351.1 glycine oxidase ThiO [Corynebacterium wankanglinii]MCR5929720.1 glycine oxidase ThiO [Corynebacterium sp. zg912]QNP94594.1 glycine oxidase ThiO [Corynebacterium wankanglinii]